MSDIGGERLLSSLQRMQILLPRMEASAARLRSTLGRWWSDDESMRILKRVVPNSNAMLATDIFRAMEPLRSETRREIREELQNLMGSNYTAGMVAEVRGEIFRLLMRKRLRDELGFSGLRSRRSSGCSTVEEEKCCICLDLLHQEHELIATLDCGHEYHLHCITPWLMRGANICPLCRGKAVNLIYDNVLLLMIALV